jgi:hypothetical protein
VLLGGGPDPLKPIHQVNPEVPEWVSEVIIKGLAVRQDERFSNAAEMQKALRRAYNKGKATAAATAAETLIIPTEPQAPEPAAAAPVAAEPQEMETQLRIDVRPEDAEPKQSQLKTEIFTAPVQPVEEQRQPDAAPQKAKAAAAAASQPVRAQAAARPTQKKSKAGLVVGGLVGLLVLGAIAAGGGWYVYNNYYAGAAAPSPTPAPSIQPSPSATADVTVAGTNVNSATTEMPTDPGAANVDEAQQTPRPNQPSVTRGNTARPPQNPNAKATPKPKARDDRTVILQ